MIIPENPFIVHTWASTRGQGVTDPGAATLSSSLRSAETRAGRSGPPGKVASEQEGKAILGPGEGTF